MCRETDKVFIEGALIDRPDEVIDRLSHELTCLVDLGVLTSEEEEAFSLALEDVQALASSVGNAGMPAGDDRLQAIGGLRELSRMIGLLVSDLDLAYQRLSFAA